MDLDVCGGIFLPALAEAGYFLQSATLISNFSTAKRLHSKERKQKPFATQTPPRKRGYHSKECKCLTQLTTPPKPQKSSFCTIHKTVLQNRRATGARIWGSVHSKTIFNKNVTFNICKQSTGLTFPTILPMAR